jgi:VWFA-related protein
MPLRALGFAALAALPLLFPAPAFSAPPAPEAAPDFGEQVEVNVVNVEVYVTDKDGRRVPGLRREDFELLEDGKPVDLVNFAAFERHAAPASKEPGAAPSASPSETAAPAVLADPMTIVVYVDNSNVAPAHRSRAVRQLREFLTRSLSPGDRVMVVSYDLGLKIRLPLTDDRAALARALEGLETLATAGGEAERARSQTVREIFQIRANGLADPDPAHRTPCPLDIVQPARSYAETARGEVLRTIGALTVLVNSLSGVPGRKALLHVSDGISITPGQEVFQVLAELCGGGSTEPVDRTAQERAPTAVERRMLNSGNDEADAALETSWNQAAQARSYRGTQAPLDAQAYSTAKEWSALAAHASSHRVTLYTLQASGAETLAAASAGSGPAEQILQTSAIASIDENNRKGSLSVLAADTGGRAVFNANDLTSALASIQEDFGTYYSLGYSPAHSGDGKEHRLEVKVKHPGVQARYRRSYRDKPLLERTVDRTLAVLFYGLEDNPLEVGMEIGDPTPVEGGKFAVPVRLRIPLFKVGTEMKTEDYQARVRLLVATRGADGSSSPVRQVQVPIRIPRDQAMAALAQYYLYELTLHLGSGEQRVAVAVRDDMTLLTSFLGRTVQVGGGAASR